MDVVRRPTIASIAEAAQVSRASVYAALNAEKSTNIRLGEELRKRILRVADEFGYVRNEGARALVTGRSGSIGVMLTDMEHNYFVPALQSMYDEADKANYSLSVSMSLWSPERERKGIERFCGNRVDGIVWAPSIPEGEVFAHCVNLLKTLKIPLLILGISSNALSDRVDQAGVYSLDAAKAALEHLLKLGRRKILIANARLAPGKRGELHRARLEYVFSAAAQLGLRLGEGDVMECFDNAYGGVEMASRIAATPKELRPEAVMACDDMLGRALVAGLDAFGVSVPDEVSVIGYDDAPGNENSKTPLSSVSLKSAELGAAALRKLLRLIEAGQAKPPPEKIVLKPEVVERASCAPSRRYA